MDKIIETTIAVAMTAITYLFGGWNVSLIVLVGFMILDFVSGIMVGSKNKDVDSQIAYKGLKKKCMIIFILIAAVMLDRLIGNGDWLFRTMVSWFYIANEGISLLENAGKLDLPVPKKLGKVLVQLKEKSDDEDKERIKK